MKKIIVIICICIGAVFCLTACGGPEGKYTGEFDGAEASLVIDKDGSVTLTAVESGETFSGYWTDSLIIIAGLRCEYECSNGRIVLTYNDEGDIETCLLEKE